MANFKFDLEDMFNSDKLTSSAVGQIHKDLPEGAPNLTTSRHKSGVQNPLNVTMFNLAEILMKAPGMNSPEDILSKLESIVTGTVGTIYDEIKGLPGAKQIAALLPADVRAVVDGLNPDDTGKADKDKVDGADASAGGPIDTSASGDVKGLISIARSTIGTTESPPGTNMTKFHKDMGYGACYWCALWIMWCFKKAGIAQPQITASCQNTFNNYSKLGRVSSTEPKVGSLCFFQYSRNNQLNHIGIVIGFDDQYITTIEANTSSSNKGDQSNGGGVFEKRHSRSAKEVRWFAYPIYPEVAPPTTTTTNAVRVQ